MAFQTKQTPVSPVESESGVAETKPLSPPQTRSGRVASWRIAVLTLASLLFAFSTTATFLQAPRPVGVERGSVWTWEFWRDPLEWNSIKRLPSVDATLRSVFALEEGTNVHVWIGGNDGFLLHSPDGGAHWEQLSPVRFQLSFAPIHERGSFGWSLTPSAQAEVKSDAKRKPSQALNAQTAPNATRQTRITTQANQSPGKTPVKKPGLSTPATQNESDSSTPLVSVLTSDIDAIAFDDSKHGFVLSGEVLRPQGGVPSVADVPGFKPATLYETHDSGNSWSSRSISYDGEEPNVLSEADYGHTVERSPANTTSYALSQSEGWAAEESGGVFHTKDAGVTWLPQTQGAVGKQLGNRRPYQYPAPWYYLVLVGVIGMAATALKPISRAEQHSETIEQPGIANLAVSDRALEPGDPDVLGCSAIATALSGFIRNNNTIPPLTIAVTGEWGSGKSSVMNLLRRDLESFRMRPIWFNAWHNQTEENLFATLLQNLRLQGIPRWWEIDFLPFRWRLLVIRLRKNFAPMLVLACVVAALGGFEASHQHSTPNDIVGLQQFFQQLFTADTFVLAIANVFKEPLVFFLAGLITLAISVFGKLKAFGIDPANLLSSSANRPSIADLDRQTSVRQRFAEELQDVTLALGPRKMVIFIDDLDRCQPDNACEVLEAINFIVCSGTCFVIMGLARRPVEACVGLSFSKVAEEMTAPAPDPQRTETPATLRSRFARQYLDKLINIEIPVPTIDGRAEGMIVPAPESAERPPRRRPYLRFGVAALVAVIAIYGSFSLTRSLTAPAPEPQKAGTPSTNQEDAKSSHSAPNTPRLETAGTQRSSDTVTAAGPARTVPTLARSAKPVDRSTTVLPIALAVLAVLFAMTYAVLTRRTGLVVYDSPEFLQALDVWKEFIVRTHTTPRSIKRCMNRVRCAAMRVNPGARSESLGVVILRGATGRWSWLRRLLADRLPAPSSQNPMDIKLRESTIVALTAIHDTSNRWLNLDAAGESGWLRPGFLLPSPNDPLVDDNVRAFLGETISQHARRFSSIWPPPPEQLAVFLRLMGSLTVR